MTIAADDKSNLILDELLRHAAFEGWTARAIDQAVAALGLPRGTEHIYAAGGALGLIHLWSSRLDQEMTAALMARGLDNMRIRDKVTEAVWIRMRLLEGHEDAARRALARLSLPDAGADAAQQLWASSDAIWTAIGDVSDDYNYYTKRMILSGVIGSTLLVWLSDDSEDKSESRAFLERRIGNVMQFEKAKGQAFELLSAAPKPKEMIDLLLKGPRRRRRRS